MNEETLTFDQARARLEDIVSQVRKKDTALEASLDLLEEGVRLANLCTEQIDHTQWREATGEEDAETGSEEADSTEAAIVTGGEDAAADPASDSGTETDAVAEAVEDDAGDMAEEDPSDEASTSESEGLDETPEDA